MWFRGPLVLLANGKTCVATELPCGDYRCQPGIPSCYGRCASDSHCRTGFTCTGGYCQ